MRRLPALTGLIVDTELCISRIRSASETIWSLYSPDTAALPVPACPAWTLRDLVVHLADVHHFWAETIHRADPSQDPPFESAYREGADVLAYARECLDEMVEAIRSVPADSPCYVWWVEPATAGAVAEHQVYEAEVHRWDAEGAVRVPAPIDQSIALMGIPEWIASRVSWMSEMPLPLVTFETNDVPSSSTLGDPSLGSVAVRGTASDVYLYLNGRLDISGLSLSGDIDSLSALTSRMEYLNG